MKLVSLLLASVAMFGAPNAFAQEAGYVTPKTAWGTPDFDGTWTNASRTALERYQGATKLVVSEAEAQALLEKDGYAIYAKQESTISKLDEESSKKLLADRNSNRAYNRFWFDPGTSFMKIKGEYRTSFITDPPSGKVPLQEGKKPPGTLFTSRGYEGPEVRGLGERCISWSMPGPVVINSAYNNNVQLVQTPTHLMLMTEMVHDVRIIPIFKTAAEAQASHGPIPKWFGDSVAWYEGNTLVVETVNPYWLDRSAISPSGKATERWTRWNNDELLYEFKIDDPSIYTQVWGGEQIFNVSKEAIYEYACHEGNYGLEGILAGARQLERDGRGEPVPVMGSAQSVAAQARGEAFTESLEE